MCYLGYPTGSSNFKAMLRFACRSPTLLRAGWTERCSTVALIGGRHERATAAGDLCRRHRAGCFTQFPHSFCTSENTPTASDAKETQDRYKGLEVLPLPEGISNDRFQMYEIQGTAGTDNGEGLNTILAVHGPPELLMRGDDRPLEGAGGGCFAIIEAGGTQYKVMHDDAFYMNRTAGEVNEPITFDKILLIGSLQWTMIGRPYIPDARVIGTVEEQTLSGKLYVVKFKKRKGYRRKQGHRQKVTRVRVNEVQYVMPPASLLEPYEVEFDPKRPPLPNNPRFF